MTTRVEGRVNYIGEMTERPRFYANDHSRDVLNLDARTLQIEDVRRNSERPSLQREGFCLVEHRSAVRDFRDRCEIMRIHYAEIQELLLEQTGADKVVVTAPGVLRFAESSPDSGRLNNSRPARFIHIDVSDATAQAFADRSRPDVPDRLEWSFEALLVRHNTAHRWCYFSNMTRDEALIFTTNDSEPGQPHHVPHTAFNDPTCPAGAQPRASVEMRAIAYWFAQ